MSCEEVSGVVYIRAQTNGLPNHCFHSTFNTATDIENEWTVVFNADMTGIMNYSDADFDTSAETDEKLCDLQRTASANMHSSVDFNLENRRMLQQGGGGSPPACHPNCSGSGSNNGGGSSGGGSAVALTTASGIALTGGIIYNALAGGNVDAVENELDTLDVCTSHPSPNSEFHYHYWGACMRKDYGYWSDTEAPDLCRDIDDCLNDTANYMKTGSLSGQTDTYTAANWDDPIGLGMDGHVLLGPYKSDGTSWDCADRDVCNGAFVDGSYVYVGSDTFPYVVGCWGPGPDTLHVPGCTTNGCGAT